jgi:hypothetical protein
MVVVGRVVVFALPHDFCFLFNLIRILIKEFCRVSLLDLEMKRIQSGWSPTGGAPAMATHSGPVHTASPVHTSAPTAVPSHTTSPMMHSMSTASPVHREFHSESRSVERHWGRFGEGPRWNGSSYGWYVNGMWTPLSYAYLIELGWSAEEACQYYASLGLYDPACYAFGVGPVGVGVSLFGGKDQKSGGSNTKSVSRSGAAVDSDDDDDVPLIQKYPPSSTKKKKVSKRYQSVKRTTLQPSLLTVSNRNLPFRQRILTSTQQYKFVRNERYLPLYHQLIAQYGKLVEAHQSSHRFFRQLFQELYPPPITPEQKQFYDENIKLENIDYGYVAQDIFLPLKGEPILSKCLGRGSVWNIVNYSTPPQLAKMEQCLMRRVAHQSSLSTKIKRQLFDPFLQNMISHTKKYQQKTQVLTSIYFYLVRLLQTQLINTKDTIPSLIALYNREGYVKEFLNQLNDHPFVLKQPETFILSILGDRYQYTIHRRVNAVLALVLISKWKEDIQTVGKNKAIERMIQYLQSLLIEQVYTHTFSDLGLPILREHIQYTIEQLEKAQASDREFRPEGRLGTIIGLFDLFKDFKAVSAEFDRMMRVLSGTEEAESSLTKDQSSTMVVQGLDADDEKSGGGGQFSSFDRHLRRPSFRLVCL